MHTYIFLFSVVLYFAEKSNFKSDGAGQRSALCRSRRELSNGYFLAKFRFDTAENEPCKVYRTVKRTYALLACCRARARSAKAGSGGRAVKRTFRGAC